MTKEYSQPNFGNVTFGQLLLVFVHIALLKLHRSIFSMPQKRHQHFSAAGASFACVCCLLCK